MKHIILTWSSIVLSLVFFLCTYGKVSAVSPTPILNLPGIGTCGYASAKDPDVTKCCKTPKNSPDLISTKFKNSVPAFGKPLADIMIPIINKQFSLSNFTSTEIKAQPCMEGSPSTPGDPNSSSCVCIVEPKKTSLDALKSICANMNAKSGEKGRCEGCLNSGGYWSSLGCFSGNVSEFISEKILGTGVGVAGGISLLCIMFAAFQMQTSSGNAEKIKKAQELLTNCITGLMVIIFSVLILKIIGVDILRLPNFIM